ncbi:MAG TPA: LacI family DNA-binding transcriptional regulator [Pseudonocardia sp.]
MAVTISDVAKAAGVSPSTVSRALTRPERVDAETRTRIFEQIERLGYQVNRAARGLVTGRTSNLAVIVSDLANPFFPDIVKGVQIRAQRRNLTTLLADSGENPEAELDLVSSLAPQVDGIILCGSRMSDEQLVKARQLATLLLVNRSAVGFPAVTVDNVDGMHQAVRHLRALRHRRIGYVGGPDSSRSHHDRLAGARRAAAHNRMELVELGNVDPSFSGGAAAAHAVLLAEVSAVLTYNDVIAIGLMHRLVGFGVRVPDEISVVGFDDIPLCEMTYPPLTTVRFPRREAGEAAVDQLMRALNGAEPEQDAAPLPTELVVRGSTTRLHVTTQGVLS